MVRTAATIALLAMLGPIALPSPASAAGVSVRAYVDREEVEIGDEIVLSIEVFGASRAAAPDLGSIEGFDAAYLGPSTQISIVQGKVSSTVIHRYRLVAVRAGKFSVGPFAVAVGGREYRTAPILVRVGGGGEGEGRRGTGGESGRDIFVELALGQDKAFVRQRIPVRVTLYAGGVRLEDIEFPLLQGEGFALEPFEQPRRGVSVRGRARYNTMVFESTLVPQRTGRLAVGPAVMKMSLLLQRRRWDDLFGDLWRFDPFAERRPIEVRSETGFLDVVALPEAGKPADFSGAVGKFDFSVSAKPLRVKVGDPVTVQMTIRGEGNLAGVTPPEIRAEEFKSYPVQKTSAKAETVGATFEQVVIPKSELARRIPPIAFSYFDPSQAQYVTIASAPIALVVLPSEEVGGEKPSSGGPQGDAGQIVGEDIVFIKDSPGELERTGGGLHRSRWFWLLQAMPLLAFLLVLFPVKRRERLLSDPRYARWRKAGREARRRLRAAARRLGRQDGALFEEVDQAVREYLAAKLDLPPGAVEPQRVAERLGNPEHEAAVRLRELLVLLESVRFGGVAAGREREERALGLGRELVRTVERERSLRRGLPLPMLMIVSLAFFFPARGAVASGAAEARAAFFAANELYRQGRFEEAAEKYRRALATGLESASVHFNLGNAYFRLGDLGRALASYERARRLGPRDPDVEANLEFARSRLRPPPDLLVHPLWRRLLFPLAAVATAGELVVSTSIAYSCLMALLICRLLAPGLRRTLARASIAVALCLGFIGANAAERVWEEEFSKRVVVVADAPAPVRFEPSETGTVHFEASRGTVLLLERREPGWLQVERGDGMRGWMKEEAAELI